VGGDVSGRGGPEGVWKEAAEGYEFVLALKTMIRKWKAELTASEEVKGKMLNKVKFFLLF